jgi:hypothetical protein
MKKQFAAVFVVAFCVSPAVPAVASASGWQERVSPDLLSVYHEATTKSSTPSGVSNPLPATSARADVNGRVQIDVHFECASKAPIQSLTAAGMKVTTTVKLPPMCVVEGWVAPAALPKIAMVATVEYVKTPVYRHQRPRESVPSTVQPSPQSWITTPQPVAPQWATGEFLQGASSPNIDFNGTYIASSGAYISQTNVNGTGVTVGVMSGDVASLAVIQSRGELPSVNVVPSSASPNPTDEGTMMLEEVHAVAPGASLAFCGPQTEPEYINCLQELGAAGATILVDDLAYPLDDLMSSSGQFAQSVANFLSANPGILLFTVTENYNGSYWEGNYAPVTIGSVSAYSSLTCPTTGQTDYYAGAAFQLVVHASGTYPLSMQWADPWGQNVSNFEVYAINTATNALACFSAAGSANTYFMGSPSLTAGTYDILVATPNASLSGKFIKFFAGGDGATTLTPSTSGSIVSPQAFVPGVVLIGAVDGSNGIGDQLEAYSGVGPLTLQFPTASQLHAPTLVSTDAITVDATGTNFSSELWSDGLFHGTSAASPNAAGVAALIKSAFPSLTPGQLTTYIESGATILPGQGPAPDNLYGYGRVSATGTLGAIPVPTISGSLPTTIPAGSSSPATSLTVGGIGNLTFSVQSDNPSLIPAAIVSVGTPGVVVTPGCAPSIVCTVSVAPVPDQSGTATVSVVVRDGANRTASLGPQMISVPAPPPPPSRGGGGGGAFDVWSLLVLGGSLFLGKRLNSQR